MDNIKLTYVITLVIVLLACFFLSWTMLDVYLQYGRISAIVTSVGFAFIGIFAIWRLKNIDEDGKI
jgi:hypothetical protein